MNQVYPRPLPLEHLSHLPPHPTPLIFLISVTVGASGKENWVIRDRSEFYSFVLFKSLNYAHMLIKQIDKMISLGKT